MYNLYHILLKVIKSTRTRWPGRVTRMG